MQQDEARLRKMLVMLPSKYREKVLKLLDEGRIEQASKCFELAWKELNKAPPPSVSDGTLAELTERQQKVKEGLEQGFSVNKISKLYGYSARSVRKAKEELHKKESTVPFYTPPRGTAGTVGNSVSRAQVHNFVVEVAVPCSLGVNWRSRIDPQKVLDYHTVQAVSGLQEFFDLSRQVSVRATKKSVTLWVKDVWGNCPADCSALAWQMALEGVKQLEGLYQVVWPPDLQMRLRGGEWALVGHEVAKLALKERRDFVTIVDGAKQMWTDRTPGPITLEFAKQSDAERSYHDEEARVFRGLTNENLTVFSADLWKGVLVLDQRLIELARLVGTVVKVQEQELKMRRKSLLPESQVQADVPKFKDKPGYIG